MEPPSSTQSKTKVRLREAVAIQGRDIRIMVENVFAAPPIELEPCRGDFALLVRHEDRRRIAEPDVRRTGMR